VAEHLPDGDLGFLCSVGGEFGPVLDNRVIVRGLALLDELMQADASIWLRTRENEMPRFCGRFVAVRSGRSASKIYNEIPVNVDGELGTVM
jgi:hypothetical protein